MDTMPIAQENGKLLNLPDQYSFISDEDKDVFNDFALLASQVCATPMAIVNLVISDSELFSANIGVQSEQIAFSLSKCSYCHPQEGILVVEDTLLDNRFTESVLVTNEPPIRFLACVPLHNMENYKLGTLCVMDYVPRVLTPNQLKALEILRRKILNNLETRRNRELLEKSSLERNKIEVALNAVTERFQRLIDASPEAIIVSSEGNITFVNPAALTLFGVGAMRDLLGQSILDYIHPEDQQRFASIILSENNVSSTELVEIRILTSAGNTIPVEAIGGTITYQGKAARQLFIRDISARKNAEFALQRSMDTNRALLTAMPDIMFRINSEGVFVNYRAPREESFFVPPEQCIGKKLDEVFPVSLATLMLECVTKALETRIIQILEYQLPIKEELRYFEGRFVISDKNEVMLIIREITDRKRAEGDIYKALAKEKELGELKNRFITMISHEFRTPLTTILSSAELLEYYGQKWGEAKRMEYFKQIYNSVGNMTYLLDDILLIGRAESKKLEFKPAPLYLYTFCLDLIRGFKEGAGAKHNFVFTPQFSQKMDYYAVLDENLLQQILSNLISNAVKYSPAGSTISVDMAWEDNYVVFRVSDNGIGIPTEGLNHLYNPFYRGSNIGTVSGTGLGLAIVKNAVDLHQGLIEVQSEKGVGSTFTVKIPHGKLANEEMK